jgi:tetratricopeptide (TPR) repeat protein
MEAARSTATFGVESTDGLREPGAVTTRERMGPGLEPTLPGEPELVGTVIDGRYRIVSLIGLGGMGRVFLAEHLRLQRQVAVKVLLRAYSLLPEVVQRFEREAVAVARLDHPNCLAVHDFGRLPDGSLFLVMSYYAGVNLRAAIDAAPISIARACHVTRHLLSGLAHAHHAGIVHRDVKPDNVILVRHEGDGDFAKLLDFGIAKLVDDEVAKKALTTVGQRFGTPAYMSPEQALGKPVDARTDLYSLTAVLFEMLTGRVPFFAEDEAAMLALHAGHAPPRLAEVCDRSFPPELEALVRRGLAKDPGERWNSAEEYLTALDGCLARPAARTSAPAAAGVLHRALRWRPLRYAALASLIGLASAMAIYRWVRVDHAAEARALVGSGHADQAVAYLELRLREIADDPLAQLELGHAYSALRRYDDALVAYERVRSLNRSLADDRVMRANLVLMLDDERTETATAAARFLIQFLNDEHGRSRLVALASYLRVPARRAAMRGLAESLGLGSSVDRVTSYALDLDQAGSCADRQRAVLRLRALGDPAVVAVLNAAQARKANACIRSDLADAIRYLESASPDHPTATTR